MLNEKEISILINKLVKNFSDIKLIIQFGSSISGDYTKNISDVDLAIITNSKRTEKKIKNFIFKYNTQFEIQAHIFSKNSFIKSLRKAEPLSLSILYTGKLLYNERYYINLKNKNFKANNNTIKRCILNSFAALSLAISDLNHDMFYDSVNSCYHAARSSIWATLFKKEITPKNNKIFELIKDKKIINLYKKIIEFRNNIPKYKNDFNLSKKIYEKGNINKFTQLLEDSTEIIKINYKKIFKKNFIGFFELLKILNKRYEKIPEFYSVFLSINWNKGIHSYGVILSFKDNKRLFLDVNTNNGQIKEKVLNNV